MAARELVPNTPTSTAQPTDASQQLESHSQSYLFGALGINPDSTVQSTHQPDDRDDDNAVNEATNGVPAGEEGEDDRMSTVADSQLSPSKARQGEQEDEGRHEQASGSHSQPVQGPEKSATSRIDETSHAAAESLDRTAHEADTFKRYPPNGRTSKPNDSHEPSLAEQDETASVSMDMTKAEGKVLHAQPEEEEEDHLLEVSQADSTGRLDDDTQFPTQAVRDGETHSDSQKENASAGPVPNSPTRSASRPASTAASVALGPRNSRLNVADDANGPSSSPAVERELLGQARSKRPPPFQTGPPAPASSADPDIPASALLASEKAKGDDGPTQSSGIAIVPASTGESDFLATGLAGSNGPVNSTPAILNAPPPNPSLGPSRTAPDLAPPAGQSDSAKLSRNATEPTDVSEAIAQPLPLATSSAMKDAVPVKPKKKRGIFDDMSQSSGGSRADQSQTGSGTPSTNGQGSADEPPVSSEKASAGSAETRGAAVGLASAPMPGEEEQGVAPTQDDVDMDVDEPLPATMVHESVQDSPAEAAALAAPLESVGVSGVPDTQESSIDAGLHRPNGQAPLFAPGSTSSSPSRASQSQRDDVPPPSAPDLMARTRLSDISQLRSSSEAPPTQYEVQPTQKDYDILRSSKSQDRTIDNTERWHASFQVADSTEDQREKTPPAPAAPAAGRALKRKPPPPSPVRNGTAHTEEVTDTQRFGDAEESAHMQPQANVDVSTLAQPTQHAPAVPDSSPDVPLAKKARRAPSARPSSALSAQIVPDSDGASPPVAGPSRPRADAKVEAAADEEEDLSPLGSPRKLLETAKTKANGKGKGKGKGKARAVAAVESVDAIDFLAGSGAGPAREVEETNYDDVPTAENGKTRRRRSASGRRSTSPVPPVTRKSASPDKGKRRAVDEPSSDLESEYAMPAPKKKRKARSTTTFELDIPPPSPASSRGAASSAKKTSTARQKMTRGGSPTSETAAPAKKGKAKAKAEPKRRSTTGSAKTRRTASPDVEEAPQASPSRRRSVPARAESAGRDGSVDVKPNIRRLPDTAPFTRVFGLWRDDQCFYSGTIRAASAGSFSVKFDDGNPGKLGAAELRYCQLHEGDRVRYYGKERDGQPDRDQDLVVVGIERIRSKNDAEGHQDRDDEEEDRPLEPADIITVEDHEGERYCLPLNSLFVAGYCGAQLDARRPTAAEFAAFDSAGAKRGDSPKLCRAPQPVLARGLEIQDSSTLIFSRTAFIVTKAERLKEGRGQPKVEEFGATQIEWEDLFEVRAAKDADAPPVVRFATDAFADIDEIFLLSDRHCSTPKYLAALALGIPCLSTEFFFQSVKDRIRLPWQQFLLPAGHLRSLDAVAVGAMFSAATKEAFDLNSLEDGYRNGGVFAGCSFLVVQKSTRSKQEQESEAQRGYQVFSLLACSSAKLVHFTASVQDAKSASTYDHVLLLDDRLGALPAPLRSHKGLVTVPWIKQCLVAGKLLPPARSTEKDAKAGSSSSSTTTTAASGAGLEHD